MNPMPIPKAPRPTAVSAPFWQAAARNELVLQRCSNCRRLSSLPRLACPSCLCTELGWEKMSGRGEVYSYTVVRRAASKAFRELVPYVYAIVEIDEGPRLATNIVDCTVADVHIGQRVHAVFHSAGNELALVRFAPEENE